MEQDRKVVVSVVWLLGAVVLLGIGMLGAVVILGQVQHRAVDMAAVVLISGPTLTALGALGALLAQTRTGGPAPQAGTAVTTTSTVATSPVAPLSTGANTLLPSGSVGTAVFTQRDPQQRAAQVPADQANPFPMPTENGGQGTSAPPIHPGTYEPVIPDGVNFTPPPPPGG